MSITDELRKWVEAYPWRDDYDVIYAAALIYRIEAEHERKLEEAKANFDFYMPNHRVALPYDEAGDPIDLGDEVYNVDDGPEAHFTVEYLMLDEDGWTVMGEMTLLPPSQLRHWEAPTVEDVLQEFADKVCSSDHIVKDGKYLGIEDTGLLAEYAEKLRLAGEDA